MWHLDQFALVAGGIVAGGIIMALIKWMTGEQ
jgi:hypothetical protein